MNYYACKLVIRAGDAAGPVTFHRAPQYKDNGPTSAVVVARAGGRATVAGRGSRATVASQATTAHVLRLQRNG